MKTIQLLINNDRGFTLIEMIVVMGIMSFLGGMMAMTTFTIMNNTPQTNNQIITLRQVQAAGLSISRDVQTAQEIDTAPTGAGEFLKLTLAVVGSANVTITYRFEDMDNGMKKLLRTGTSGEITMISEYVYYNPISDPTNSTKIISYLNHDLSFQVAAIMGTTTVMRKYNATQRAPSP